MVSTKHFHAGRAAAAFTASQQQPAQRGASQRQPGAGDCATIATEAGRGWESPVELAVQFPASDDVKPRQPQPSGAATFPQTDTYERARQRRAERRGCAYVPPTPVVRNVSASCPVIIDMELVRICIALHFGLILRIWLILLQLSRENNASGFTRKEIAAALHRHHIRFNTRSLTRWLNSTDADKLFWMYDPGTGKYYHTGYSKLCDRILAICDEQGRADLYETNHPGQRRPMHLNVASGSLLQFERNCYTAWVASRDGITAARITLSMLWGRTDVVIRSWEGEQSVQPRQNFSFVDCQHFESIPRQADGTWRPDVRHTVKDGRDIIAWQMPNTYTAIPVKMHPHKGQMRRVFERIKKVVSAAIAAGGREQGSGLSAAPGGSNLYAKRYFNTHKGARNHANHNGEKPRYIWKGEWNGRYGYFEFSPDGKQRFDYWECRRVFRRHQCVSFTKRAKLFVAPKGHPF